MVTTQTESTDTLVIGGGQAGLSIGRALKKRGIDCLIVDASPRVGDAWRKRWDWSISSVGPVRWRCCVPTCRSELLARSSRPR